MNASDNPEKTGALIFAFYTRYASEHQGLPPNITAFLQGWTPPS
jgi:hypothetical protein